MLHTAIIFGLGLIGLLVLVLSPALLLYAVIRYVDWSERRFHRRQARKAGLVTALAFCALAFSGCTFNAANSPIPSVNFYWSAAAKEQRREAAIEAERAKELNKP